MTRALFVSKWATLVAVTIIGYCIGWLPGILATIGLAFMARADRAEFVEYLTTAGQFMDFHRREQATSAFDSDANIVHVEFDPARDDLREITEEATAEGFEVFDHAEIGDGLQVLIFRRTVHR